MPFNLFMHHIDFCSIFFCANLQFALSVFFFFFVYLGPCPSTMPGKTRAYRTPSTSSESPFRSEVFRNDKSRKAFETLNCKQDLG